MGFFDFLKPKKTKLQGAIDDMLKDMFPKGKADIDAGTNELLYILNHKISRTEAQSIFIKSVSISRVAKSFDKERLRSHLAGYCLHYFNEQELEQYYNYINSLRMVAVMGVTPADLRRMGDGYAW